MKKSEKKSLNNWDWLTLVAAWRYYEHRSSIVSATFPHDIVTRFFTGRYDEESCKRIAHQFVMIDHRKGPDDKITGWVGDDIFCSSDRRAWRLFYFYLSAVLVGFKTAKVTVLGVSGITDVFCADGNWYSRTGYERFGDRVSPYMNYEIEFSK